MWISEINGTSRGIEEPTRNENKKVRLSLLQKKKKTNYYPVLTSSN